MQVLLLLWSNTFTTKKGLPTRDEESYKCGKKRHFKAICISKKEEKKVGRAKDAKGKQKPANVHELRAQVTAGIWPQHPAFTKRSAGRDVPPHEDSTSDQPQQARGQQTHQTTVVDKTSHSTGP